MPPRRRARSWWATTSRRVPTAPAPVASTLFRDREQVPVQVTIGLHHVQRPVLVVPGPESEACRPTRLGRSAGGGRTGRGSVRHDRRTVRRLEEARMLHHSTAPAGVFVGVGRSPATLGAVAWAAGETTRRRAALGAGPGAAALGPAGRRTAPSVRPCAGPVPSRCCPGGAPNGGRPNGGRSRTARPRRCRSYSTSNNRRGVRATIVDTCSSVTPSASTSPMKSLSAWTGGELCAWPWSLTMTHES